MKANVASTDKINRGLLVDLTAESVRIAGIDSDPLVKYVLHASDHFDETSTEDRQRLVYCLLQLQEKLNPPTSSPHFGRAAAILIAIERLLDCLADTAPPMWTLKTTLVNQHRLLKGMPMVELINKMRGANHIANYFGI